MGREVVLPLLLYVGLSIYVWGEVALRPARVVFRQFLTCRPEDALGTVWFYHWFQQAIARGVPVLAPDIVCAPRGALLENNFPNHVDAWLAAPLFALFPFPISYNLWWVAIPVLGALGGFFALRAWTRWTPALVGGALLGFNAYSLAEIAAGRPTTGLLAVIPLFVGCFSHALHARGKLAAGIWTVVTGAAAALSVYYHVVYALVCVFFAVFLGGGRILWPAAGTSRWRPLWSGLSVLLLATFLSTSYLYQSTALQGRLSGPPPRYLSPPTVAEIPPPWDPAMLSYLADLAEVQGMEWTGRRTRNDTHAAERWRRMTELSLPVDMPWRGSEQLTDPSTYLPLGFFAPLVVLVALLGGRRSAAWLAVAVGFYVLTLGPYACRSVRPVVEPFTWHGARLRLPAAYLVEAVPPLIGFFKPHRLFPGMLLSLVISFATGLEGLSARFRRWRVRWVALPGAAILGLVWVGDLGQRRERADLVRPFEPPPFLLELARQEDGGGVVELPVGIGHGLGGFQLVHGRVRAGHHHDQLAALQDGRPPPTHCYSLGLARRLWDLGRRPHDTGTEGGAAPDRGEPEPRAPTDLPAEGLDPAPSTEDAPGPVTADPSLGVEDPLSPRTVANAWAAGFRYVLVYPDAYDVMAAFGIHYDLQHVHRVLRRHLGDPVHESERLVAYTLAPRDEP